MTRLHVARALRLGTVLLLRIKFDGFFQQTAFAFDISLPSGVVVAAGGDIQLGSLVVSNTTTGWTDGRYAALPSTDYLRISGDLQTSTVYMFYLQVFLEIEP